VVALVTHDNTYDVMLTNIKEIRARAAPVIAIAPQGDPVIRGLADVVLFRPATEALFSPVVNVIILQLLAYYTACKKGCPVDMPRNLAKSVTVE
jgi:glutamine---fructose-6-phosphate transaminase (isomerizing)